MRVLMLSLDRSLADPSGHGGGDTFHRHATYAKWLSEDEASGGLHVIVRGNPGEPAETKHLGPLTIQVVPTGRWALPVNFVRSGVRACRDRRFDLITCQTPFDDGAAALLIGRIRKLPVNVQMRSSFLDNPYWIAEKPRVYPVFNRLGRAVSRRAATIRLVSQGERDRLAGLFPELKDKLYFLPPMVNRGTFSAAPLSAAEGERRHGAVFVGRLTWQKNIETLLEACRLLREEGQFASVCMIGDGPLRAELEAKARALGVDGIVKWHGALPIQALPEMYRRAVLTVLPSFHEGFGKVIVESYLSGTPVVAGPVVSARELINDGETGFILPKPDDVVALARHIGTLLRDRDRARSMGAAGHRLMLEYLPSEDQYRQRQLAIWRATAAIRAN